MKSITHEVLRYRGGSPRYMRYDNIFQLPPIHLRWRCTVFDRFIVSYGLVDVKLEGYACYLSHPSASQMRWMSWIGQSFEDEIRLGCLATVGENKGSRTRWLVRFQGGVTPSLIALIPQCYDAKFVIDFRLVQFDWMHVNWVLEKKEAAMFFKVDCANAYESVRWGLFLDILHAFGVWAESGCWVDPYGTLLSDGFHLVNGSPTSEFPFCCGLKQGDPLAPYLFILIMESLHISFSRVVDDGVFKGDCGANTMSASSVSVLVAGRAMMELEQQSGMTFFNYDIGCPLVFKD
ncbi:RNA-directed DNA polymerase, eukaryota [Tanacetum coccineum]